MILVVGARAAGKRAYVRSLGYSDADFGKSVTDERAVLYDLQEIVFYDPAGSADLYDALLQKEVVICDEVGSGIIPACAKAREAREACGRLCCRLAQQAEQVVRVVCGIPAVLKG